MNLTELEKQLEAHAESVKNNMAAPFDIETEELIMTDKKNNIKKTVLVAAAIICIITTTVFAAMHFLSPGDVAENLGDLKLAEAFENSSHEVKTATDGKYCASLLGVVSGENLSDFKISAWNIIPERTYAVVAIEKTDKTAMTVGEPIMVTPLIEGLEPWQYNIASMHGGYTEDVFDGILYRIIEMDSIECFADQKIYMAVTDSPFISNEQFSVDEKTGEITANEDYDGTNILFELEVDKTKANPEKAKQYLIELKEEWSGDADVSEEDSGEENSEEDADEIEFVINPDFSIEEI